MRNILLGFIGGIVTSTLVVFLVVTPSDTTFDTTPAPAAGVSGPPVSTELETTIDQRIQIEAAVASRVEPTVNRDANELTQLREKADEAKARWQRARFEFDTALAATSVAYPIELPREFDWVSERPTAAVNHDLIQREPIDPDWAYATEEQVMSWVAKQPELIQKYGYPAVFCRTTTCELQFVSYDAAETQTATIFGWNGATASLLEESWGDQFASPSQFGNPINGYVDVNAKNGVTTILWHLRRAAE